MAGPLPIADPAPADGRLPTTVTTNAGQRDLGLYIHVPFCRVRCGYCDFNTYTATELRGARQSDYADDARAEIELAAQVVADAGLPDRPLRSVFFGGGTPTLLPATDLAGMLKSAVDRWPLADHAEVTTEANPDSVDRRYLAQLADAGFTRVSFGMQSAVPEVLATLERSHDPERIPTVVEWARQVGLAVSLDLIYGAPGETIEQWRTSLDAALQAQPDHLSAYALIVEDGTKLARQIRRGELPEPDDDLMADKYELADELLAEHGYRWYEISNWAKQDAPEQRSVHNLNYWLSQDWWGIGPGAHSHIGGVRWWNVKHPAAYRDRVQRGESPAAGRETLDAQTRYEEMVLLQTRIALGVELGLLNEHGRSQVPSLIADGLIEPVAAIRDRRLVLTLQGRLLADAVIRRLLVP